MNIFMLEISYLFLQIYLLPSSLLSAPLSLGSTLTDSFALWLPVRFRQHEAPAGDWREGREWDQSIHPGSFLVRSPRAGFSPWLEVTILKVANPTQASLSSSPNHPPLSLFPGPNADTSSAAGSPGYLHHRLWFSRNYSCICKLTPFESS